MPYKIEQVILELRKNLEQHSNRKTYWKFKTLKKRCGLTQNRKVKLGFINLHLNRNDIVASIIDRNGRIKWNGERICDNSYITFDLKDNLMKAYNDYPDISLLDQHIKKSRSILLAVAYLDEVMIEHLVKHCKDDNIKLRVVCDYNYNSNIYARSRIRAKVESVGEFRTSSGRNDEGIMHTKIYVFYMKDNQIAAFNTSANFTASAWKSKNIESPVTVQVGDNQDSQLLIMINTAEETWKMATEQNPHKLAYKDKVVHKLKPELGQGIIYEIESGIAEVKFGKTLESVRLEQDTNTLPEI